MIKKSLNFLLISFLIFSISSVAFAQRQTGTIKGKITDEEGNPLPGVEVIITSPKMQGTRSFVTTVEGDFRFPTVPPGEYVVRAALSGFATTEGKGIQVRVGMTIAVNLQLEQAILAEEVTVVAPSPVVDTESHSISISMTTALIKSIPMRRDIVDVYRTAPGTVGESELMDYRKSAAVHGGALHDSKISLDGVDLVDADRGYIAGDVSFDAIEEVEISISGHKAEVGGVSAGYVNVVSRSGGNEFSGGLTVFGTHKTFVENVIPEAQLNAVGLVKPIFYNYKFDVGLQFGGPIFKDKVWFFISPRYNVKDKNTEGLPFTDHQGIKHEEFMLVRKEIIALNKVTMQLSEKFRWMIMYQYNRFIDHPSAWAQDDPYNAWEVSIDWYDQAHTASSVMTYVLDQNTFAEARIGYVWRYLQASQHGVTGPTDRPQFYDRGTGYTWGPSWYSELYHRIMTTVSLNLTRFQDNFLGANHDFKIGIEWQRGSIKVENPTIYTGYRIYLKNASYWAYATSSEPHKGRIRIRSGERGEGGSGMHHPFGFQRFSAFLQDTVTVAGRLTLNLGVRFDFNRGFTRDAQLLAWKDEWGNGLANALLPDIFPLQDLSVPGIDDIVHYGILTPRLGLIYDIFGDGKTAFKASWSRYAEVFLGGNVSAYNSFKPRNIDFYWYDDNMNNQPDLPPIDRYTAWAYTPYVTDPQELLKQRSDDLSAPYWDEFTIGVSQELAKDVGISLDFIYKAGKNLQAQFDLNNPRDGDTWVPYTVKDPGRDGTYGTGDDADLTVYMQKSGSPGRFRQKQNAPDASKKYWGLDFIFFKRMSAGWQLQGSVTYSKQYGNYSAGYMSNTGSTGWSNPNGFINRWGRLQNDRPIIVKIMGTVLLPLDINASMYYRYFSGSPWQRSLTVFFPDEVNGFAPASGSVGIDAEPNGLQRRPAESVMDVRLEKEFKVGRGTLGIWLEVFNVFGWYSFNFNMDQGGRIYDDGTFERWVNYGTARSAIGRRSLNFAIRYTF